MDLAEDVQRCQNILYQGYKRTECSRTSWLNEFCGLFLKFCLKLEESLASKCFEKNEVEVIFLATTQTINCIKYLEKVIQYEDAEDVCLIPSRQHFLDRILWCFARIKSIMVSVKDDIKTNPEEVNCVDLMDSVLDMLSPYTQYKDADDSSGEVEKEDIKLLSQHIRNTVDAMLSQILAFANVALAQDKRAITALCQKVLRECIQFQEQCSLNQTTNGNWNFQADLLENALLQLEEYINESLLRMVFRIFVDYAQFSINDLRTIIKSNPDDPCLDDKIADFDINLDRVIQIGIFANAFAPNTKTKTVIRSCLASLESLDSCLIPSIYSQCDLHSNLLEEHYHEEMRKFQNTVQSIIDTAGLCTCYIEILFEGIQKSEKDFNKNNLYELLEMAKILQQHFEINRKDLRLEENNLKKQYKNLSDMISECQAILACADQIDSSRVLKRFKILRSTIVKLKVELDKNLKNKKENSAKKEEAFENSDEFEKTSKMFESVGITPTKTNVFYKSKRNKNITDSLIANFSQLPISGLRSSVKIKRKVSLRTAIFKKQKSVETKNLFDTYNENSTSLQITDILDQITNLSKSRSSEKCNSN